MSKILCSSLYPESSLHTHLNTKYSLITSSSLCHQYVPVMDYLSNTQSECTLSHILSIYSYVPLYQKYINDSGKKEDKGRRRRMQRCRKEVVNAL